VAGGGGEGIFEAGWEGGGGGWEEGGVGAVRTREEGCAGAVRTREGLMGWFGLEFRSLFSLLFSPAFPYLSVGEGG